MDSLGGYKDKLYFYQKKSNDYELHIFSESLIIVT